AASHGVELAGLYEYEHDRRVLEFYDQPPAIKLYYQAKNGRQVSVWHTPDYFVLRGDAIGWEEWKTDEGLEPLTQTMPHRYCRDTAGHWRCPPGERFAAHLRLRPSTEVLPFRPLPSARNHRVNGGTNHGISPPSRAS